MNSILDALGPVFLIVLAGAGLNHLRFPEQAFWPLAEKFTYFILFPALLIYKLAQAPFEQVAGFSLLLSVVLPLVIAFVLLLLFSRWLADSGPAFTSIFQGSIRFNTYVGLAASEQLFGEPGLIIAALVIAVMIPLINVLCVTIFALKSPQKSATTVGLLKNIAKNPLIVSCLIGILLNVSGIGLPHWSGPFLSILSQPALPLGLLAVGAGLNLTALGASLPAMARSSLIKLFILPLLAWFIGRQVGLSGVELQVIVLFFSLPTASSAYILARQLGGDAPLMAAIISGQALLAMLTMPLVMLWVSP
ncbi:MAG: AEC family transporter [Magnetococcales bacterium]|nr:AEC family transporter [Magnetococcales bacterium]